MNLAWLLGTADRYYRRAVAVANAYADSLITTAIKIKGGVDCSTNPNYWVQANKVGWAYLVTVAGKIGGAAGKDVEIGDLIVCKTNNGGGDEVAVGTSWFVLEKNDVVDAAAGTGSLRTLGTGALQACAGSDTRLADSRTPAGTATAAVLSKVQAADVGTAAQVKIDASLANIYTCTLDSSRVLQLPTVASTGASFVLHLKIPAASGWTLTFLTGGAGYASDSGVALPVLSGGPADTYHEAHIAYNSLTAKWVVSIRFGVAFAP